MSDQRYFGLHRPAPVSRRNRNPTIFWIMVCLAGGAAVALSTLDAQVSSGAPDSGGSGRPAAGDVPVPVLPTSASRSFATALTATAPPVSRSVTPTRTPTARSITTPGVTSRATPGTTSRATVAVAQTGSAAPATHCWVNYHSQEWPGGLVADVAVANTGSEPIENWVLVFSMAGGQTITNAWNAAITQSGTSITARSMSYNAVILPGQSVWLGFQAAVVGTAPRPTSFTVSGQRCTSS